MKQTIVVFDFDETLGVGVSGLRFFRYFLGKTRFYSLILRTSFWHLLLATQLTDNYALNKIVAQVFTGKNVEEVTEVAENFAKEIMPHYLYGNVLEQLKWHKATGLLLLVDHSIFIYVPGQSNWRWTI